MTPARTLPRRGPFCRHPGCDAPLGEVETVRDDAGQPVRLVRRCWLGHEVTAPPEPDHDIDLRPCTSGDLEG